MMDTIFLAASPTIAVIPTNSGPVLVMNELPDWFGKPVDAENLPVLHLRTSRLESVNMVMNEPAHHLLMPTISFWSHVANPSRPPKTVFIRDLGERKLVLTASIPVSLEFWPDLVTACCYDLEEFGVGSDESSALNDLRASIVSLYRSLKEEKANLGPLPQRHWHYLSRLIAEQ